jgi:hypothetical protein
MYRYKRILSPGLPLIVIPEGALGDMHISLSGGGAQRNMYVH